MGQIILITPESLSKNFEEIAIQVQQGAIVKLRQGGSTLHIVKDMDVALVKSTAKVSRLPKVKKTTSLAQQSKDAPKQTQA